MKESGNSEIESYERKMLPFIEKMEMNGNWMKDLERMKKDKRLNEEKLFVILFNFEQAMSQKTVQKVQA